MEALVHDADSVFEALRNAILEHRFPPGLQLKEQPLADRFGVPRAVIRQALMQLAGYKLAEHRPNQGMFVATPSLNECRDVFAARRLIEAAIVESLAGRLEKAQIAELRTLIRQEDAAYRNGQLRRALRLSVEFHRVLARFAGNSVYRQFLEELVARTPLIVLTYRDPKVSPCSLCDHGAIIDALEANDADTARRLMVAHLGQLEQQLDEQNERTDAGRHDLITLLDAPGVAGLEDA